MKYEPKIYTLSNGVTVILDPWQSTLASVRVAFRGGANAEPVAQCGITHFTEHMLCAGGQEFQGNTYLRNLGGHFNAMTNPKQMCLCCDTIPANLPRVLDVYSDALRNPAFNNEVMERERGAVLDELQGDICNLNSSFLQYVQQDLNNGVAVPGTLGTESNIKSFTRKECMDFARRNFVGHNCVICISGDFDIDKIMQKIEQKFAFLPDVDAPQVDNGIQWSYRPRLITGGPHNVNAARVMTFSPQSKNPDLKENIFNVECLYAHRSYLKGHLTDNIRHLVYKTPSMVDWSYGNIHTSRVHIECDPNVIYSVTSLLSYTIDDVINGANKINNTFLERYRRQVEYALRVDMGDAENRCKILTDYYIDGGYVWCPQGIMQRLNKMTVGDIVENTRDFFAADTISLAVCANNTDVHRLKQAWNEKLKRNSKLLMYIAPKDDKVH